VMDTRGHPFVVALPLAIATPSNEGLLQ
jgi:hypothetical protein